VLAYSKDGQVLKSEAGKQLVFVTNNSTKSRASYKAKFDSMKIPVKVVCGAILKVFSRD